MHIESLEGRTLLSASVVSTQVKIDRLIVKADLLKFRSDIAANSAVILADIQLLRKDGLKNNATLKSLFKSFRKDVNSMHQQLFSDRLDEKANVLKDQLAIALDQIQIQKDKHAGNDTTADKNKLLADRVQLQTDEIAGLDAGSRPGRRSSPSCPTTSRPSSPPPNLIRATRRSCRSTFESSRPTAAPR